MRKVVQRMNKQEAIKWLERMLPTFKEGSQEQEVTTMAIDALEEPTEVVTDCISRERAIEIVKRAETKEIAHLALINLEPKEIPTCNECRLPECLADKQNDWIPVSELPKDARPVLVYAWNVHHVVGQYKSMMTHDGKWEDMWVTSSAYDAPHKIEKVIAWKPLTIPDKESGAK